MIEEEFFKAKDHVVDTDEIDGPFTEHHLDTSVNELTRNDTSKSVILAPFNSTQTDKSFILAEETLPRNVIKFGAKVREIDRQFERNNNCELDNGVYNKLEANMQAGEGAESNNQFDPFASNGQDLPSLDPNSPRELDDKPKKKCVARITETKQLYIG